MPAPRPLEHVRVVIAHGDPAHRAVAREMLIAQGAEVLEAAEPATAAELVRAVGPDVILLDRDLDAERPTSFVRDVAGDPELLGTAVVLLAPGADTDAVVAALDDGAVDVWTAPSFNPELIARVRLAYRTRMLLDLALRRYSDLEDLAYRDELTELPNRRGASRQLEVLMSRAKRHGQQLAVMLVDADRFKAINDDHGHAVGDLVLRELAQRLRERVRREDVVGRWGGEEFLIALPETTRDGAVAVAEALRAAIADRPMAVGPVAMPVTVSIGVAGWAGEPLEQLVERSDRALYAAKAAGRDCVMVEPMADVA